jgi:hypothetical protein
MRSNIMRRVYDASARDTSGIVCVDPAVSYDLDVYVPRALEPAALRAILADTPSLVAADDSEGHSDSLIALRGVRHRYCFTVDGPTQCEPEDVPESVTAAVLGARHLYSVVVEGSSESDIPHAVRFARRLAKDLDGAVVDRQLDEVWSKARTRSIRKPAREERVDVVDVDIYCLREGLIPEPARLFAAEAQRFLPEALPRRFGEYEPLQGKLAEEGIVGFCKAWAAATSLVFLADWWERSHRFDDRNGGGSGTRSESRLQRVRTDTIVAAVRALE